jgi:hypothetical protein
MACHGDKVEHQSAAAMKVFDADLSWQRNGEHPANLRLISLELVYLTYLFPESRIRKLNSIINIIMVCAYNISLKNCEFYLIDNVIL